MGRTEVTVAAYKRFASATRRGMPEEPKFLDRALNRAWSDEQQPMTMVTWDDAAAYCRWAGGRLPTEAQWEYAARAGTTGPTYGDLNAAAWYFDNSGGQPHAVGQKQANAFGLYDMLGNVWEWVADWYGENYYGQSPAQDPQGPSSGQYRVLRGGSLGCVAWGTRVSVRGWDVPGYRFSSDGFRCVREAP